MTREAALRRFVAMAALLFPTATRAAPDPLEPVNRHIHAFNAVARRYALAPLATLYEARVPDGARAGIVRVIGNLGEPASAISALAAGDTRRAWNATARFGINATLGWGGWRDAAIERGFAARPMTPGEAACAWGVPSGPFLVLPLLGPTTLRDAAAGLALSATLAQGLGAAPVAAWQGSDAFVGYAGVRAALSRVEAEALDAYAALRSIHAQRRAARCELDHAEE
jgi:phospholipid-binding lipoprotein MlaA